MNKFKAFFTFLSFLWLCLCGFWGIYGLLRTGNIAWMGLIINAWALPLWMLMRFVKPERFVGDQRESPALMGVVLGLGFALLTDSEKGLPVYFTIYNLFIFLFYLHYLSALRHPQLPVVDSEFPALVLSGGDKKRIAGRRSSDTGDGVLVVFLRGAFCSGSRELLTQLAEQHARVEQQRVRILFVGCQPAERWSEYLWQGAEYWQLDVHAQENHPFIASWGMPVLWWPLARAAARPSIWLLDGDGNIVWRHLAGNYRVPAPGTGAGKGALVADQVFRLQE